MPKRCNCTWVDRNGVETPVDKMQDMHLFNVVACHLRTQAFWRHAQGKLRAIKKELERRGMPVPTLQDLSSK